MTIPSPSTQTLHKANVSFQYHRVASRDRRVVSMGFTLKNVLLVLSVSLLSLFALEALTRLVLDDGMLYELEMWKYAREVKVRDPRPELGHRHRPNAGARLLGATIRTHPRRLRSPAIAENAGANAVRI